MDLKDCKVLVADDHMLLRQMVVRTLLEAGIVKIDGASDGGIFLEKLRTGLSMGSPYHVAFLDLAMPNTNGYEALATCRADPAYDQLAIIILSAEADDTNIIKALEAGATAYITKPFKPEDLVGKLRTVLEWRAQKTDIRSSA